MGERVNMRVSKQRAKGEPGETTEAGREEQGRHRGRGSYCKLSNSGLTLFNLNIYIGTLAFIWLLLSLHVQSCWFSWHLGFSPRLATALAFLPSIAVVVPGLASYTVP